MNQFNDYINTILKDLKIDKKKKGEMAEEFLDHLQMLKMEYLSKGLTESDATKQAMITFGEENGLKSKLSESILNYKNLHNIIGGILILLIIFIFGSKIPISGYDPKQQYFFISSILLHTIVSSNIIFIALGYYLPIFSKKLIRIQNIILVSIVIGVVWRAFMFLLFPTPWNSLDIHTKLIILVSPLGVISNIIGYVCGFALLQLIHRTSTIFKRLVIKTF